jgi:lipoprotein-releasing system ATP-binding protein
MHLNGPLLAARNVRKSYFKGRCSTSDGLTTRFWSALGGWVRARRRPTQIEVPVLMGVDLAVEPGEFVSVVGTSGTGKSTLLHVLGTLDKPDAGEIHWDGQRIDNVRAYERDAMRNQVFGFIFQFYHLLPELSALENVLAPLMIRHGVVAYWRARKRLRDEAAALLERVGLGHRLQHKPNELSGGEMQRTAIARALAARPQILLADEPTGNLDAITGQEIIDLLVSLNRDEGLTIIMVTHDQTIAQRADRSVRLVDGRMEQAGFRDRGSERLAPA